DLAAIAGFGLVGDAHACLASLLAEQADSTGGCSSLGRVIGPGRVFRWRDLANYGDLFAVNIDRGCGSEPVGGQPPGQPGIDIVGGGKVGLLPTTGPAEAATTGAETATARAEPS